MMCFGFSARRSPTTSAIVTGMNRLRADKLAELVALNRVFQVRSWTASNGHTETSRLVHPEFYAALNYRYVYPRDRRATLISFADKLREDAEIRALAEARGITLEGLEWTIEQSETAAVCQEQEEEHDA